MTTEQGTLIGIVMLLIIQDSMKGDGPKPRNRKA